MNPVPDMNKVQKIKIVDYLAQLDEKQGKYHYIRVWADESGSVLDSTDTEVFEFDSYAECRENFETYLALPICEKCKRPL